jgi:hypothetical protein
MIEKEKKVEALKLLHNHANICLSMAGILAEFNVHMSDGVEDENGVEGVFSFHRLSVLNELFCKLSEEQVRLMKEITDLYNDDNDEKLPKERILLRNLK